MTVDSGQIPVKRFRHGQLRIIWIQTLNQVIFEGSTIRTVEILLSFPIKHQINCHICLCWRSLNSARTPERSSTLQISRWLFAAKVKDEFWVLFILFHFVSLTHCSFAPWVVLGHMWRGNHPVFSGPRTGFLKNVTKAHLHLESVTRVRTAESAGSQLASFENNIISR